MKVELHLHTSQYSRCATASPEQLMQKLVDNDYDAVYITEHNAVWSETELSQLQELFPQIRIFGGVELSVGSDLVQHLLVLGTSDPSYLRINDPQRAIKTARSAGHLTILAHPFRWEGGARMLSSPTLPDAIEHLTSNHHGLYAQVSLEEAERLQLPVVNTGDVHGPNFVGRYWIETYSPLNTPNDIREIILNGAYTNRTRE